MEKSREEKTITSVVVAKEKNITEMVLDRIKQFQEAGALQLPPNYSAPNALKSAWIILQELKDKDKNLAINTTTKTSQANALLKMVTRGLNPLKKQGYFVTYGNQLSFDESYHGTQMIAKRDAGVKEVRATVIYFGDEFEYSITDGVFSVVNHSQALEDRDDEKIKGVYVTLLMEDGSKIVDIMNMNEVKRSWMQSQTYLYNEANKKQGTHQKFTAEMAKRTVIKHALKPLVNSTDDKFIFFEDTEANYGDGNSPEYEEQVEDVGFEELEVNIETGEIKEPANAEIEEPLEDSQETKTSVSQNKIPF